jgi:predicted porin
VDIGFAREDNGVATANRLDAGNQSGSRVGFKGSEDLGGGLSAIFTLENGFNSDTGTLGQGGRIFGRQAWVGLQGGFGAVKFGRQYTPIFGALDTIDPLGTGITGGGSGITTLFNPYGVRMDNTVNYSVSSGAFSGQVAYGFGEVAGSTSANRQWGLSGTYANGPITGVLAYHNQNNAAGTDNAKTTLLGGVYNFGPVALHAAYAWNKGVGALDERDAMIGVTVPVSAAGNVIAEYQRKNDKAVSNDNSAQWALAYTHTLSKRTNVYTSYSRNTNDALAARGGAAGAGLTDTLFNVGIRHKF